MSSLIKNKRVLFMETKREYKKPEMTECKVQAMATLMQSSQGGYTGGGAFRDDAEKDYYA